MRASKILLGGMWLVLLASSPGVRGHGDGVTWTEGALGAVGLRIDRSALTTKAHELQSPLHLQSSTAPTEISVVGSSVVVELGRMGPDGRFIRPRLNIGLQSSALKSWMTEVGLAAENCMAPLLRGRFRRNTQNDEVGATILISARCTFY